MKITWAFLSGVISTGGFLMSTGAAASQLDVLWYTYAPDGSEYKSTISGIAANAHHYSDGSGVSWNLNFWSAGGSTPGLSNYDVLVIHGGEAFRTNVPPGTTYATPDYSGILNNRTAIEAARGERTLISGSDADFHAVRGDTGRDPLIYPDNADLWDGALGHVINSVNWAGSGQGLGVVSWVDAEWPEAFWWENQDSFLRDELFGQVSYFRDNQPVISPADELLPVNDGLTTLGLSDWTWSFHAAFEDDIPGYTQVIDSGVDPAFAAAIATTAYVGAETFPVPLPPSGWLMLSAFAGLWGWRRCSMPCAATVGKP